MARTDIEYDVVVVGSGAAGISTAIKATRRGLRVLVLEKDRYLGGTSAISGGWLWVPGNEQGVAEGDTREEAERYIRALAGDTYDERAAKRFLDEVPAAIDFFENEAGIAFSYPETAPDYQMDTEGARKSGRALTVARADARMLGANRMRVRPYLYTYTVFGYMPEIGADIATFLKANRSVRAFRYVAKKLLRTWFERLTRRRAFLRTNGNALMTRLIASAGDLGIPMWTKTRVTELVQRGGEVTGVQVDGAQCGFVRARLGVVLATGGFSAETELRKQHFPHDPRGDNHVTPTVGHDGDAYHLAKEVGGVLDSSPHQPAAWAPVTEWRNLRGQPRIFPHLRAFGLPGLIAVDRAGERFANESLSYHDFGVQMLRNDAEHPDTVGYIIADRTAMRTYGIGYAKPWPVPTWYYKKVGYLVEGATVAELARKIGVPGGVLARTLREFNSGAVEGRDPRFGRGSNWFHHFKGDVEHTPNPNLAPIERGPFYAVRIRAGDLGTYAGLSVNDSSEVVTGDGVAVRGLYAVGSAAVSVFGGGYPGYGANIGPALVFGHQIGRDIADREECGRGR